jgi:hypothetical protein
MPELYCVCTSELCGHEAGKRCEKPINQQNAKPFYQTGTERYTETGGWICDECWERVKSTLP